jgi:anthranilate synthase/aminodeoxychorismate synthase-like glutamine amidotransferase
MLLMIDNYDSFTYNLVQYLLEMGEEVRVVRNDAIKVDQIEGLIPERIVISPGPCDPKKAGISVDVVKRFTGKIPILGVCLGHQAIGYAFGGDRLCLRDGRSEGTKAYARQNLDGLPRR